MKRNIEELKAELAKVRMEIGRLAALYDPKSSRNHQAAQINALLRRQRNLHININQLRQK